MQNKRETRALLSAQVRDLEKRISEWETNTFPHTIGEQIEIYHVVENLRRKHDQMLKKIERLESDTLVH